MRLIRRLIVATITPLLISCGLFSALSAQTTRNDQTTTNGRGNNTIRGKIFMPNGRFPEMRMRVILEMTTGGIVSDTFSDTVGGFEFRALASGNYRVVVPSDGQTYETGQEVIEMSGPAMRTYVSQIYLREKPNNQVQANGNILSAFVQDVPKNAKKSYEQGLKKLKGGKQDEAAASFQEAINIFPEYVMAHDKLGQYFLGQQKFTEAQTAFERALLISPKYALSHINLGILFVMQKKYNDAIEHLDSAARLDESYPMLHQYLGIALLERAPQTADDLARAERAFLRALALGGNELAAVHKYLFNIYLRRKSYDQAAASLEAYLNAVPNAPDAPQVKAMIAKVKQAATAQNAAPKK